MSNIVLKHQRNKAIQRVIENYPEVFEGKPNVLSAAATFTANNDRASVLLSVLARPRPLVFGPKQDQAQRLRTSVSRLSAIGMLIATRQSDVPKLKMYKAYKRASALNSVWDLHETALQVAAELEKEPIQTADTGLSASKLAEFESQVLEFGLIIEATDAEVKQRKAARQELTTLLTANILLLRLQLEPFANLDQEANPAFYRDFKIASRNPIPNKQKNRIVEVVTDLSGTVTNTTTGEPIAGATILVTELNLVVTTDEDGYYLFDEIPAGAFTISCHAAGHKLPANVSVIISDTQPLQLDFELEPEAGEQAA